MLSVDGLVSGIDTTSIIGEILSLEQRPLQLIGNQVDLARQRQTAFLDLSARLLNLQVVSRRLSDPATFRGVQASSTQPEVLAASAGPGVPPGSYSFQVVQLARGSQFVSGGFADSNETAVGAGTLSLELGGFIDVETELDDLNGGNGVARGFVEITDRAGNSALVDLTTAITVNDVIDAINSTGGIEVRASVAGSSNAQTGRGLVIEDTSGGTGNLKIEEVSDGSTAADLGILGDVAGDLEGSMIQTIGRNTRLSSLNDGLGLRGDGSAGIDLTFAIGGGSDIEIDVDSLTTVGDLLDAANANGDLNLSINATGNGFEAATTGGGSLTVSGSAGVDLGLDGTYAGGSASGEIVYAGLNDILLSTFNGGSGVAAGSIQIQDKSGAVSVLDLSGARSLQDVLRTINDAPVAVTASINDEGNGLLIRDTSGGTGSLEISESGATTTAQDLGILSGPVTGTEFSGADLDPRYIHQNTLLSSLNGGRGVQAGSIRIIDAEGKSFTVDLSQEETIGEVIRDIEGAATLVQSNISVSINAEGNGLVINSPVGSGTLRIEEEGAGTTAADLGIAGESDVGTIDGSFEKTVTISATDTLEDVQAAINALGIDVAVSIVNDGSSNAPFRLSVISNQAGSDARLQVDTEGGTNLGFQRTASAQDSILFYGESGAGTQPVLLRSNSNTFTDVIEGLTVTAQEVSTSPVRVNVTQNDEGLKETINELVARYNEVLETVSTLTSFNVETETRGILLGDGTVRNLESTILRGLTRPFEQSGARFALASQIGLRVQNDRLSFDVAEFDAAMAEDPQAVRDLFAAARPVELTTLLDDFNNGGGVASDAAGPEFQIQTRDNKMIDVDITGANTLEDVIDAINTASGGDVTASLSTTSNSLVLIDNTTGSDTFRVVALNGSSAFNDLGINKSADVDGGAKLTGFEIDLDGDIGIAARLTDAIERLVNVETGSLQSRADSFDQVIANLEDRIEQGEERLSRREELLRRQFAQLEQIMQASQQTLARLNASLSSISG